MLKAVSNNGDVTITMSGDLAHLIADTTGVINAVYNSLNDNCGKRYAQIYREQLMDVLMDPKLDIWEMQHDDEDKTPVINNTKPIIKFGNLDLKGCESEEDAAKALVSLLRNMGVPIPEGD